MGSLQTLMVFVHLECRLNWYLKILHDDISQFIDVYLSMLVLLTVTPFQGHRGDKNIQVLRFESESVEHLHSFDFSFLLGFIMLSLSKCMFTQSDL